MNYFPFHIGDYASATRHLSWDEDMAYRRLLDVYYTTEKPLPPDLRACCRLAMATTEQQRQAVDVVLQEFFKLTDEGWINTRADTEIHAMREKQQKQRDKANKRWHKPEQEPGIAPAMPRHTKSDATAQKADADAMPPTPTPTPTPTPYSIPNGMDAVAASPRKRASRLPDGWQLPKAWGEWALTEYPAWTADIVRLEGQKFADHWHAKGGKDGAKLDWEATWRNWCRSDICQRTHSQKPTFAQQAADVARTTVPSRPGKDPTLVAIEQDRQQCGAPPASVRQHIASILPKARVAT